MPARRSPVMSLLDAADAANITGDPSYRRRVRSPSRSTQKRASESYGCRRGRTRSATSRREAEAVLAAAEPLAHSDPQALECMGQRLHLPSLGAAAHRSRRRRLLGACRRVVQRPTVGAAAGDLLWRAGLDGLTGRFIDRLRSGRAGLSASRMVIRPRGGCKGFILGVSGLRRGTGSRGGGARW